MNVAVVIVTYGHRFHLLHRVLASVIQQNINKVYVVNNCSHEESRRELISFASRSDGIIRIIDLTQNLGSAGGFKKGLEAAVSDPAIDFLWLLDDDNCPDANALDALQKAHSYLGNSQNTVLYSYRGSTRGQDYEAVFNGVIKGYDANSVMGYTLRKSIRRKLLSWSRATTPRNGLVIYPLVRTKIGPYGGMFLHKSVVRRVGLPNPDFFVYGDDHEFSTRMDRSGCLQYIVYQSKIYDIDETGNSSQSIFSLELSEIKFYFGIRNHIYLDKLFISNHVIYYFNFLCLFLSLLKSACIVAFRHPRFIWGRLCLMRRAMRDGLAGNLGVDYNSSS